MRPFGHGCHLKDEKIEGRKNEGMKKIIILPIKTITIIYNKFNHHICLRGCSKIISLTRRGGG